MSNEGYRPLVIIGAPRSGTNMLRDVLCTLEGVATWPCDEINYIWRHGNLRYPSDEFPPKLATPRVQRYIRRQFEWVARRYNAQTVIEKTCANSLRVPFVDRVVPEARYLFIRRDGLDAVASAMHRWKAELDIPYLARKARFVPITDLPYYAPRYVGSHVYRLFSKEGRVSFWGPQLDHMDWPLANHSLDEVCALQWKKCVESAAAAFAQMPSEQWLEVQYEDFVFDPESELRRVLDFVGLEASDATVKEAVADVSTGSLGKWRAALGEDTLARLQPIVDGVEHSGTDASTEEAMDAT